MASLTIILDQKGLRGKRKKYEPSLVVTSITILVQPVRMCLVLMIDLSGKVSAMMRSRGSLVVKNLAMYVLYHVTGRDVIYL